MTHPQTPPPAPREVSPARVGDGVPVVDLTLMVRQLYVRAEQAREGAATAAALSRHLRIQADYLENLAATLDGLPLPAEAPGG